MVSTENRLVLLAIGIPYAIRIVYHRLFKNCQLQYLLTVSTSTSISNGFATWAFIPASSACCTSEENAFAVMAIIGISFACGCADERIRFVPSHPFNRGIST